MTVVGINPHIYPLYTTWSYAKWYYLLIIYYFLIFLFICPVNKSSMTLKESYVCVSSPKLDGRADNAVDSREKLLEFCFDYCYWSVHPADPHYASQEEVMAVTCLCTSIT